MEVLRSDRVLLGAGVMTAAAFFLGSLPLASGRAFLVGVGTDLAFVLLTVVALLDGLARLPDPDERRFWATLAGAFGVWTLIQTLYLVLPQRYWGAGFDLAADSLYLVFYLLILAAVDRRPDLRAGGARATLENRYRLSGAAVFSVGIFIYFILIPSLLDPTLYSTWSPSFLLYLSLDVYLAGRLLLLALFAATPRWRRCFALTAALCALFVLSDLAEYLTVIGVLPSDLEGSLAGLWLVPSLGGIVAVRLRAVGASAASTMAGTATRLTAATARAPFLAYVLAFPLVHFAVYRGGLFGTATHTAHENFVLLWMFCLGAISLAQHLELERRTSSLLDERRETEERLSFLANFDALTGLPNRSLFLDRLAHAVKTARRDGRHLAVMLSDLDDFKRVNDSYGPGVGDELLRCVAARLEGCLRESDTVARLGGDDFAVLVEALEDAEAVDRLTERIGRALASPFEVRERTIILGTSQGVALFPQDGDDAETLLANADAAIFEAKGGKEVGGINVRYFSEATHGKLRDRLRIEIELRAAVEERQFVLHYQPKWSPSGTRLTGLEALVRWRHPERGLISPGDFIPLAESTGLIGALGDWVLETGCAQLGEWRRLGHSQTRLAVNLAAGQFRDPELTAKIRRILASCDLEPASLEVELTETMVLSDQASAARICQELGGSGVRVAIDDFGAGNSSLSYLTLLWPHRLKIDRTFISGVAANPKAAAVVMALITMAHRLGMEVTGEGVETEAERSFLQRSGCNEVQGYLLGRPQPAETITALLDSADPRRWRLGLAG